MAALSATASQSRGEPNKRVRDTKPTSPSKPEGWLKFLRLAKKYPVFPWLHKVYFEFIIGKNCHFALPLLALLDQNIRSLLPRNHSLSLFNLPSVLSISFLQRLRGPLSRGPNPPTVILPSQ